MKTHKQLIKLEQLIMQKFLIFNLNWSCKHSVKDSWIQIVIRFSSEI